MSPPPEPYVCPECGWRCVPARPAADEVVRCAVEIEKHLTAAHDFSFRSTNAGADDWTARALRALPPDPTRAD